MARMREIGASFDKGYRDDLNYNFGLLEALIGEANGLTDALRQEMLNYINNLQQQIDMLTGENIGELLDRLNDSIQQALTAAQDARTAKTATEEATALATTATELANASALLAEEKANYANEKAVIAQGAADNANQEASNLSQLKIDVVQATQDAKTATGNANQATQAAQTATNAINVVLPNVEGLVNLKEWNTETQYKKNNFVTLEGNGYMALRDNKGVKPPSFPVLSNADWAMFVQKGEKGEQGTGVRILGTLPDESSLPPIGEPGDAYLINGDLYVWSDTTNDWTNVGTIKGPKGDTGPQGPEGPQGLPGKDADLTEVNQEIANLQQTVTNNQQVVTEHLGQSVASENGAHGIRYVDEKLEIKNGTDWLEIQSGKPNANGTVKINDNHAVRYFHLDEWGNDTYVEYLRMLFPNVTISGSIKLRVANKYVPSIAGGGNAEILYSVHRAKDESVNGTMDFLAMHSQHALFFKYQTIAIRNSQPYLTIIKRSRNIPIYFEVEFITKDGNAFDILDAVVLELDSTATIPDNTPAQQSIFTHVGNSKVTLAASITGKGVQTSADATFAQMAANIDAIPAKLTMTGTKLSPPNTYNFKFAKGTNTIYQPYISIEGIPFEPKIIRASSMTLTGNGEEYSSLYIGEDEGLGVNLSRHVSGFFGGATATGQSTYLMVASVTSLNGKWTVIMPVPIASRNYKYTIVG